MIWSNIWRNQERKNAEIENFFGTLSLASWGLGNCDSDIAVSSIHHGSQYRLNFSDGFWVGGLEVCELCLTRILWISITQFGNRKRAWTRWVCRPPLPPTSPTSSEIMLLMDRLLPPPVTGKAMNHNGLQWCLTAGGSATWSSLPRTSLPSSTSRLATVWCPRLHRSRIWSPGPSCRRRRRLPGRRLVWLLLCYVLSSACCF